MFNKKFFLISKVGIASLPNGTYTYQYTNATAAGGETLPSPSQSIVLTGVGLQRIRITPQSAYPFQNIYGRIAGSLGFLGQISNSDGLQSFTDNGDIVPGAPPPSVASAFISAFGIQTAAGPATVVQTIPSARIFKGQVLAGACGGGTTTYNSSFAGLTPNGGAGPNGAGGIVSPIPQIVLMRNFAILCLGNSTTPYIWDLDAGVTVAFTNTFAASYPKWLASVSYAVGVVVRPNTANGHVYRCVQAGVSGSVEPIFPTTAQVQVADGAVIWKETGTDTAPIPFAAAHAAIFNGSLWLWNTKYTGSTDGLDGPSSLRMSDTNNPLSWNPLNQLFISKDDGDEGMGLATFSVAEAGINPVGTLVAFKQFSTYVIQGSMGSPNFSLQKAKTDLGCLAPRTIQFVPGLGILRMTHMGPALFDGVNDDVFLDDAIHPYLFDGTLPDVRGIDWDYVYFAKATRSVNPPLYICAVPVISDQTNVARGILQRLLAYDTQLKIWTVIDLPIGVSSLFQAIIPGSEPLTLSGDYSGGKVRRLLCGDPDWEESGSIAWSFRPEEVFASTPSTRLYVKQILMRCFGLGLPTRAAFLINQGITQDPNSTPPPLTVTIATSPVSAGSRFEAIAILNQTVQNVTTDISGTGPIEIDSVDWDIKEKPAGVPVTLG